MQPNYPNPFATHQQQQPAADQQSADQQQQEQEQPVSTPTASHAVGDVVTLDTVDATGEPITGPAIVTAVHDDDEGGLTVAPLAAYGFRVSADQLAD